MSYRNTNPDLDEIGHVSSADDYYGYGSGPHYTDPRPEPRTVNDGANFLHVQPDYAYSSENIPLQRRDSRKVRLVQDSVLSLEYPVPSAVSNAIESKYLMDDERTEREFTHMRCKALLS